MLAITDAPRGALLPGRIAVSIRSISSKPFARSATTAEERPGTLEAPESTRRPA